VLVEVRAGTPVREIARRLDLSDNEVSAMVDYWAGRGLLTVSPIGRCLAGSCGGCGLRSGCHQGRAA
jgi:predicted DNA-binding transcriptional regulator